jgi:hypothetical protein
VLAPTVALEQQVREQYRQEEDLQELVVSPEIIDKFRRLELEEQNFQQQSQTHQKQVTSVCVEESACWQTQNLKYSSSHVNIQLI